MKKLIVVSLVAVGTFAMSFCATRAIAQEIIPMISVRKSVDLKWLAGERHVILVDGVEFAAYTVPANNEFRGRLNLDGVARPVAAQ